VLVGDGSYLLQNVDIYSSVLTGHKLICVVCDNGGFAVIDKLQRNVGHASFNNLLQDCSRADAQTAPTRVDFVLHARAMGATSVKADSVAALERALHNARQSDTTVVIVVDIDPTQWSSCDCWWDVGLPAITHNSTQAAAVSAWREGQVHQRHGI
jgi:3D-(3,5/4)-trihydroxycyclohexane-1,2-dione acylhydrolase (decyclizing)